MSLTEAAVKIQLYLPGGLAYVTARDGVEWTLCEFSDTLGCRCFADAGSTVEEDDKAFSFPADQVDVVAKFCLLCSRTSVSIYEFNRALHSKIRCMQ